MKMIRKITLFACMLLIAVFAFAAVLRDQQLNDALQGAWCNSDDGGNSCWGYDIYEGNTSQFCGRDQQTGKADGGTSRYAISGNRICHVVTSIWGDSPLSVGHRACFDVLSIDTRQQSFKSIDDDEVHTTYRMQQSTVACTR